MHRYHFGDEYHVAAASLKLVEMTLLFLDAIGSPFLGDLGTPRWPDPGLLSLLLVTGTISSVVLSRSKESCFSGLPPLFPFLSLVGDHILNKIKPAGALV